MKVPFHGADKFWIAAPPGRAMPKNFKSTIDCRSAPAMHGSRHAEQNRCEKLTGFARFTMSAFAPTFQGETKDTLPFMRNHRFPADPVPHCLIAHGPGSVLHVLTLIPLHKQTKKKT